MTDKLFSRRLLVVLFFILCSIQSHGQNGSTQRISWTGSDFALRYQVVIEREVKRRFQSALVEYTDEAYIEVSLEPGKYRLRIIPYDFRDMPATGTRWMTFVVNAARDQGGIDSAVIDFGELEEDTAQEEEQDFEAPFNIFLSAGFMPFLPFYEGHDLIFDNTPSILGAALRLGVISTGEYFNINPGLEAAISWYNASDAHGFTIGANFLAQKLLPKLNEDIALNFRLGTGYTLLSGQKTKAAPVERIHINLGLSFLWKIFNPLFLEIGIDHTHYFTEPASGCFRPWLAFGISL
ncbi:MAG: hypothetical protein LBU66_03095 [Treponema sp.]|jgi:hypothetical protein|nr:hypothetical protein [Treponema sp.]